LAFLMLALPLLAEAAGLGRLTVMSALGQPLRAEIEIVSVQPGEEEGLTARLASPDAFRQAGIEFNPALLSMRFEVQRREGRTVVRVSSSDPLNEPFLDLLVELQWNTGRLVREYTFLLDPPGYRIAETPATAPAPAAPPAPPVAAAPLKPEPAMKPKPAPVVAPAPAPSPAKKTHDVKKGDTLGEIARANMPGGVTFNQMLIALYRANREAFIRENINLVREGRILEIPGRETIAAIDASEARRIVETHMAEFAEYKSKLAAAARPADAAPGQREAAGRIEPAPTAKPSAPRDQLKLSKADTRPGARAARGDDLAARERALSEAQSRVTDLEKNVSDLQKLLAIKNQQLAELEKKAGQPAAAPAPKPAPGKPAAEAPKPAAAVKPEPAKPEAPKPAPAKPEAAKPVAAAPKPAAAAPVKPEAAAPKPAAEPAKPEAEAPKPAPAAKPKPKPKPAPPPPPPPEPSLVDELLDNPLYLGGLGGVLVLLVGYGYWAWRRKKSAQAKFQDSVLGSAANASVGAASVFGAAAAAPSQAQGVAQPSVGQGAPAAMEAVEEVDPIAEADVYMAYGRDAQAEEILKEALQKDASRAPVQLKLLEIYANRRDTKSFEQGALKLKNLTGGSGPEWEKAAALGASIDPKNSLYGGAAAAAAAAPAAAAAAAGGAAPTLDFDVGGGAPAQAGREAPGGLDFDLGATAPGGGGAEKSDFAPGGTLIIDSKEAEAASGGLDFDLGGGAPEAPAAAGAKPEEAPKADSGSIDFDLGGGDTQPAQAAAPEAKPAADATASMDFDLNLDLGGAKPEGEQAAAAQPAMDLSGISLDLGESGGDAKSQEVATKLDLAKAYVEMDDKDGARELLNEVLKEGDAGQQAQAKEMLGRLG
jgi:pilus assembly protein FimV